VVFINSEAEQTATKSSIVSYSIEVNEGGIGNAKGTKQSNGLKI